ncbi:unnamed protein product [Clonostachys rosea f. rosea IK726]|uniref:Uncharacterized protein n=1 Tax=Clonostachys rosea f. rosea IK726 TaxID=1349383 RepID=A0ACA9U2I6_BIOOC|nr:unnamed protein product [Clonostachys rosea f. rosea IK726]
MFFPKAIVAAFALATSVSAVPQSGSRPLGWIYGYSQTGCAGDVQATYEVHSLADCFGFTSEGHNSIKYVRSAWKDDDPKLVGITDGGCIGAAHAKVNSASCASGSQPLKSGRFE